MRLSINCSFDIDLLFIEKLSNFDILVLTGGDCNLYRSDFYKKEHDVLKKTKIPIITQRKKFQ